MGLDPNTHQPRADLNCLMNVSKFLFTENFNDSTAPLEAALRLQTDPTRLTKIQLLQNIFHIINSGIALPRNIDGASSLHGSHDLRPLEAFVNGTSTSFHTEDPILAPLEFPKPGDNPGFLDDYQAISNAYERNEGGFGSEDLGFNNGCLTTSYDIRTEEPLPALVSLSPQFSSVDQMHWEMNPPCISSQLSTPNNFEALGEVVDDDTSGSYWKDILE